MRRCAVISLSLIYSASLIAGVKIIEQRQGREEPIQKVPEEVPTIQEAPVSIHEEIPVSIGQGSENASVLMNEKTPVSISQDEELIQTLYQLLQQKTEAPLPIIEQSLPNEIGPIAEDVPVPERTSQMKQIKRLEAQKESDKPVIKPEPLLSLSPVQEEEKTQPITIDRDNSKISRIIKQPAQSRQEVPAPPGFEFEVISE